MINLLSEEFKLSNDFSKTVLTILISWFTFFLTVNYFAIGWFMSQLVEGKARNLFPVYIIACFFFLQCILGIAACRAMRKYFKVVNNRNGQILDDLYEINKNDRSPKPLSPLPIPLLMGIIRLMILAIYSLIFFWSSLVLIVTICYKPPIDNKEYKISISTTLSLFR